jgi:UDP-N-acetylmuramyl-tripeptide synthetase
MAVRELTCVGDALAWLCQRGAVALEIDSRRIAAGCAFIAWPGHALDARKFVPQALRAGACACLVEAEGVSAFDMPNDERVASLRGLKAYTGELASRFTQSPSQKLRVLAVTGTNGKTSTAWWIAQALMALGQRCAVVGTLGVGESGAELVETGLTTPDPIALQIALKRFVSTGVTACAIEASSIGLVEQRLAGTHIHTALFTNFTQDHLDYHGSMDAYWQAKAQLFAWPELQAAVLNIDDERGRELAQKLPISTLELWTYSTTSTAARLYASDIHYQSGGLCFDLHEGSSCLPVRTVLVGTYNVANLLAVVGGLRAGGYSLTDAAEACSQLAAVPGRMQCVSKILATSSQTIAQVLPEVLVDYAHTPDALQQALLALQPFAAERGGELWCVFGCGGNRDVSKRPVMGGVAQRLAQHVVVTTDNPRFEAAQVILKHIQAGLSHELANVQVIEDRHAAITYAIQTAHAADVILIAGKGHETYQDMEGMKHHFSDAAIASAALNTRAELAQRAQQKALAS